MTSGNGILGNSERSRRPYHETFKNLTSWWWTILYPIEAPKESKTPKKKIEEFRPGYPRFTALIGASDTFYVCRCFSVLRARLLLLKQDKLSVLKQKLEKIDQEEAAALFLGKSRWDRNSERQAVLSEIDTSLADYDSYLERTSRILQYKPAQDREITSLLNWVEGNALIDREEIAYLDYTSDLISLSQKNDTDWIEEWVEDKLIRYCKSFCADPAYDFVYIYSSSLTKRLAQIVLLSVIALLLLIPALACSVAAGIASRMIIIIISNLVFLVIMVNFSKPNITELFLAAATYMTIMAAFLSGPSSI